MFKDRPHMIAIRGAMVAVCLTLLAGCPSNGDGSGSTPPTSNDTSPPPASDASNPTVPPAPAGLMATAGNAQASLTWSESSGATSYAVKRSTTSGGPYAQVISVASPSFTDTTVTNGTTYYYVVSALDSAGESANSSQVTATPAAAPSTPPTTPPAAAPATPTGLNAAASNAMVSLSWSASSGATSYHVKRSTTSGASYTQIAAPTSTGYTDTSVSNGTTYYYVVSAVDSSGESANSSQVSASPTAPPPTSPPPTTFGTWTSVTPGNANLTSALSCDNYGTQNIGVDPNHPNVLYTLFTCQGIWKSTDYGQTWTGPINTGTNGATAGNCAGGITVAAGSGSTATLYGFWVSTDGGVDWTQYNIAPLASNRQDVYPPSVDPYDATHLIMAGHEQPYLVESSDGGHTWKNVSLASGMQEPGGTAYPFFINTGSAATTRTTFLVIAQDTPYGTWRTTNDGASWTEVDQATHPHGAAQIYQPNTSGTVFLPELYSSHGSGILLSTDYGQTWSSLVSNGGETVIAGTSKNLYSMYSWACGCAIGANYAVGSQPGTSGADWTFPSLPGAMNQGAAQIAVTNDGTHNILVTADWTAGLWRYVEP